MKRKDKGFEAFWSTTNICYCKEGVAKDKYYRTVKRKNKTTCLVRLSLGIYFTASHVTLQTTVTLHKEYNINYVKYDSTRYR